MQPFTELKVWQRGHALALAIYKLSKQLPDDERFGLTAQIRRAAVSVPSNIAEGSRRQHPGDFARFLNMAIWGRRISLLAAILASTRLRPAESCASSAFCACSRV